MTTAYAITRPGKEMLLLREKDNAKRMLQSLNDNAAQLVELVAQQPAPENAFAKLFNTPHGQIVAIRSEGDEGPEVRFYTQPAGLGVCACAVKFSDTESGNNTADAMFAKIEEQDAINCTEELRKFASELTTEGEK